MKPNSLVDISKAAHFWLKFQMDGDHFTGVSFHDSIGLDDTSSQDVKRLNFVGRHQGEIADLKFDGRILSFKEFFAATVNELSFPPMKKSVPNIRRMGDELFLFPLFPGFRFRRTGNPCCSRW
ncbi:MAG TPA: hypothetical protein VJ302_26780 [Blastocatellia bacterium]|nr:hypothetical protein [Blastocatellia bacterium]